MSDFSQYRDLPDDIPQSLVVGTRVTGGQGTASGDSIVRLATPEAATVLTKHSQTPLYNIASLQTREHVAIDACSSPLLLLPAWLHQSGVMSCYSGRIEAVLYGTNEYLVSFDRPGLGKHHIPDTEVRVRGQTAVL